MGNHKIHVTRFTMIFALSQWCGTEPTPTVSISEAYQGGKKAELVGSLLLPPSPGVSRAYQGTELTLPFKDKRSQSPVV